MSMHTLKTEQELPISLQDAWDFFSSPKNLKEITPSHLGFEILSGNGDVPIYPGMFIQYTVKPLLGIPMRWVTEITQVKKGEYFVDEQRVGPYGIWHHEHHFKSTDKGVHMTDLISFQVPLGFLGNLLYHLFIKKDLQTIFNYREKVLNDKFGSL